MSWTRGRTLGTGGFGFVSLARTHESGGDTRRRLPPVVAVKSAKVSERRSLEDEKELLEKFRECGSIIHCFGDDFTTENGQDLYNILLEYADGGCLADRITAKPMAEEMVSRHTKSILTALTHIHGQGYVHCDIKPHNVLLVRQANHQQEEEEEAKLADFGSCKRLCCMDDDDRDFRGTVLYSAPESILRQEYLPESDIWALGCTVLQMLTGKSPWVFDTNKKVEAKDVLIKIGVSDEIPKIPTGKKISREAQDFLKKCLIKDPTARWKPHMLIDHPFVKINTGRRHHHHRGHHLPSIFSYGIIHSLLPHCFHHPKVATAVHAC